MLPDHFENVKRFHLRNEDAFLLRSFRASICSQTMWDSDRIFYLSTAYTKQNASGKILIVVFTCLTVVVITVASRIPILIASCIYPAYNKQDASGKLLIAIFIPLVVVVIKVAGRICIQRLWCRISHPGTSSVLLAPMYCGSAIMLRLLQVDLHSSESVALIRVIHGIAEVSDRSIMAFIDFIVHQVLAKRQIPWGGFRTLRRERLAADLSIMGMLSESSAIITVNIFSTFVSLFLHQRQFTFESPSIGNRMFFYKCFDCHRDGL